MAVASRVPYVSSFVMHMTVLIVGQHCWDFQSLPDSFWHLAILTIEEIDFF